MENTILFNQAPPMFDPPKQPEKPEKPEDVLLRRDDPNWGHAFNSLMPDSWDQYPRMEPLMPSDQIQRVYAEEPVKQAREPEIEPLLPPGLRDCCD